MIKKKSRYLIEAFFVKGMFDLLALLPIDMASYIGGWLGRTVGPWLNVHKTAKDNLQFCFPHLTTQEQQKILSNMWDNLGRTAAEFPHLPKFKGDVFKQRVAVEGLERLKEVQEQQGKSIILFSGHIANWEITALVAKNLGWDIGVVYRPANNAIVEAMIQGVREHYQSIAIPKNAQGMRKLVRAAKAHIPIAMLMDQKANEGIDIPFFGKPAKTAPAIATLALKYNYKIIPIQTIRIDNTARFRLVIHPPLTVERSQDGKQDTKALLTLVNQSIEQWVRDYPGQWFWVHRRWKK